MDYQVTGRAKGRALRRLTTLSALAGVFALGCATWPGKKAAVAAAPAPSANGALAAKGPVAPPVQAVQLGSAAVEGQTSWQIDSGASSMPHLPGSASEAPPNIQERLKYAFDLAQRGATYSAQQEFEAVLGLCALEADSKEGGQRRRDALREGLTALAEADDFVRGKTVVDPSVDSARIASSHHTPLQSQLASTHADSGRAVRMYYDFAEQRLTTACAGIPYASLAFYGLGRSSVLLGDASGQTVLKAVLMHHVALEVNPANSLAANELGVLLAQNGRYAEAERVLRQGAAANPTAEIWQNLAIVCQRLGENEASQVAMQQSQQLLAQGKSRPAATAVAQTPGATGSTAAAASKPATSATILASATQPSDSPTAPKASPADATASVATKTEGKTLWDRVWR